MSIYVGTGEAVQTYMQVIRQLLAVEPTPFIIRAFSNKQQKIQRTIIEFI